MKRQNYLYNNLMNNDIKERFEVIWYVVSLSLIPMGLVQLLNSFGPSPKPPSIGFFLVCIIMFVLRWLVTGRHLHIPFTKPGNIIICVFFFISLIFWLVVADSFVADSFNY